MAGKEPPMFVGREPPIFVSRVGGTLIGSEQCPIAGSFATYKHANPLHDPRYKPGEPGFDMDHEFPLGLIATKRLDGSYRIIYHTQTPASDGTPMEILERTCAPTDLIAVYTRVDPEN